MTDKKPIRAISIQQPYAEMILRGVKVEEYRSVVTHVRERVYIYASLTPGDEASFKKLGLKSGDLPTGVIVGSVEIIDCKSRIHPSKYKFAWKLANPKRLSKPIKPERQPQPLFFKPFKS